MSNYKDLKHKNLVDVGTIGTQVASGTTGQRGATTGQFRFNSTTGRFEGLNASSFVSIELTPTVTSIDDTEVDSGGGGNQTIVITGTNFITGDVASFIGSSASFNAATTTIDSPTQITAVAPKASFLNAQEPYGVRVTSSAGLAATLASQINVDNDPTWTTASGNIGTVYDNETGNHMTVVASDAEGDTVAYTETGGTVLATNNLTLNSSTGVISGDPTDVVSPTTLSFDLRATANVKTADRAFNIIMRHSAATGGDFIGTYSYGGTTYRVHKFTANGNFILSATTTVDYLIIGGGASGGHHSGGGGGAGGLVWQTSQSLSAATYAVVVGAGGAGAGDDTPGNNGINSSFNSIIGLGGGAGGGNQGSSAGSNGGCGGGSSRASARGTSTQYSTYSYGVGFDGAPTGTLVDGSPDYAGYSGGGTGAVGATQLGGDGHSTFDTDAATTTAFLLGSEAGTDASNVATTSSSTGTLYIGGGGGRTSQQNLGVTYAGGKGGGGTGNSNNTLPTSGLVNTGSGGGGQSDHSSTVVAGITGASGIVIVRFS